MLVTVATNERNSGDGDGIDTSGRTSQTAGMSSNLSVVGKQEVKEPSLFEMIHLMDTFGPPGNWKKSKRSFYESNERAVQTRFKRWFPDFHDRFHYDDRTEAWVANCGGVFEEIQYRENL